VNILDFTGARTQALLSSRPQPVAAIPAKIAQLLNLTDVNIFNPNKMFKSFRINYHI
jgi:hypothetical protein